MFSRLQAPLLKNTGSTARDHLASERTFLAWLRTGLGFVALGIAVERFSQLEISQFKGPPPTRPATIAKHPDAEQDYNHKTQTLVVGLLGTGSGAIVYGTMRYFSNMQLLQKGLFKPALHGAAGLSFAVAGLTGAAYWGIIRDAEEKE